MELGPHALVNVKKYQAVMVNASGSVSMSMVSMMPITTRMTLTKKNAGQSHPAMDSLNFMPSIPMIDVQKIVKLRKQQPNNGKEKLILEPTTQTIWCVLKKCIITVSSLVRCVLKPPIY